MSSPAAVPCYDNWAEAMKAYEAIEEKEAATGEEQPREVSMVGYVLAMRKLSKKIFFVDLLESSVVENDAPAATAAEGTDGEAEAEAEAPPLVVMGGICAAQRMGTADEILAYRKLCVVTNKVCLTGRFDRNKSGALVVLARTVEVLQTFDSEPDSVGNARILNKISARNNSPAGGGNEVTNAMLFRLQQMITQRGATKVPVGVPGGEWRAALCKVWLKTCEEPNAPAKCTLEGCQLRHAFSDDAERERFGAMRAAARAMPKLDDGHDDEDKACHAARSSLFANFVEETFGAEYLRSGSGVADIAGGVGAISFEFHVKKDIPCTLVDPRPPKLIKYHMRYLRQKAKAARRATEGAEEEAPQETADDEASPDVFDLSEEDESERDGSDAAAAAAERAANPVGVTFPHRQMMFDEEAAREHAFLRDASLYVGMHPDQATCPIVSTALSLNKPFCVVPCCVFPSLFPDRRTSDGEEVSTYPQYIRYLQERNPHVRTAYLPFKGRNCVVYMLPEDCAPVAA